MDKLLDKYEINIFQASKDLCINYSSAKAIMSNYRKSIGNRKQKYNLEPR